MTNFVTSIHALGVGAIDQLHHPLDTRYRTTVHAILKVR